MSRKKTIVLIALVAVAITAWYAYKEFNRTNRDLQRVRPDYSLHAMSLISEYENGDSMAAKKFNGRIIEVSGLVKKLDKDDRDKYTIVLGDTGSLSSVRCSMDTNYRKDVVMVQPGSSVTIRGACTGFNRD